MRLDLDWKNAYTDLFVDYLQVGDDEKLIELIKQEALADISDFKENNEIIEKEGKFGKN